MTVAAALFLVLAFLALLAVLRVPARAGAAIARARQAMADLRSKELDDDQKERAVQAHALALFGAFALLTALTAVALLLPAGVVWLAAQAGAVDFDAALDCTMSWPVLLVATVAAVVALRFRRKEA